MSEINVFDEAAKAMDVFIAGTNLASVIKDTSIEEDEELDAKVESIGRLYASCDPAIHMDTEADPIWESYNGSHDRMDPHKFVGMLKNKTGKRTIDYSKCSYESGRLFHGSRRLVDQLKPGFSLYSVGTDVNCSNLGGWCTGISLTDDLDTARRFSGLAGYVYVVYLNDVKTITVDVDDAAWLFDVTGDLLYHGVDLVIINNSRESEAVLINPNKAKIQMIIPNGFDDQEVYGKICEDVINLDWHRYEAFVDSDDACEAGNDDNDDTTLEEYGHKYD